MLGVSFIGGRIKTEAPDVIGSSVSRLTVVSAGVGAGYAHNWVVKRRWLLHISTLPQFIVFSRNRLTAGGSETKMPYRFPNMNVIGRIAVVRHFGRYFAGSGMKALNVIFFRFFIFFEMKIGFRTVISQFRSVFRRKIFRPVSVRKTDQFPVFSEFQKKREYKSQCLGFVFNI